jgi:hypothetical protein
MILKELEREGKGEGKIKTQISKTQIKSKNIRYSFLNIFF